MKAWVVTWRPTRKRARKSDRRMEGARVEERPSDRGKVHIPRKAPPRAEAVAMRRKRERSRGRSVPAAVREAATPERADRHNLICGENVVMGTIRRRAERKQRHSVKSSHGGHNRSRGVPPNVREAVGWKRVHAIDSIRSVMLRTGCIVARRPPEARSHTQVRAARLRWYGVGMRSVSRMWVPMAKVASAAPRSTGGGG